MIGSAGSKRSFGRFSQWNFHPLFTGIVPGAETLGLAAPAILLFCRLLQGVAVGGEYMASAVFLVESAAPGRRGWTGSWGQFGASEGTLLRSAAGAIVNATMSHESVMAYGWRIPFILGVVVGLGGLAIRRNAVEAVPRQVPANSPLDEAFRAHWRTMLHLVSLVAALSVGFYTTFVYSATWLGQVTHVPARTAFSVETDAALAPALYLAGAAALTFVEALLLPKTVQHSVTNEFQVARS